MKIIRVSFKNINSLAGEHEIDFTRPAFTNTGIFVITGKTGAGKTSILDAITLALYGRTPRVNISQNDNPVMTRGENECYAEITFEVRGKIYTASWQQGLSRTGSLKPVIRRVVNEKNEIIADKVKESEEKIREILGLSFEQFTKVIMLAQGSFAAFLQADRNDKGELLEQITGTAIYGTISVKVFERAKLEKEKLEKIKIELESIQTLSEEEISNFTLRQNELENEKQALDASIQRGEYTVKWLDDIALLKNQLNNSLQILPSLEQKALELKNRLNEIESAWAMASEELRRMEPVFKKARELDTRIAEKDKSLQPIIKALTELMKTIENSTKVIQKLQNDIQLARSQQEEKQRWADEHKIFENLVTHYSAIEQEDQTLKQSYEQISSINQEIIDLQKALEVKKKNLEAAREDFLKKETKLRGKEAAIEELQQKLKTLLNGKELIDYQTENEKITELRGQLTRLIELKETIQNLRTEIKNDSESLEKLRTNTLEVLSALEGSQKELQLIEENIRHLNDFIQLARTVQSLEEHRLQLKDGEPCPLCGSTDHPYARGNVPSTDDKEKELDEVKKLQHEIILKIRKLSEQKASIATQRENLQQKLKNNQEGLENRLRRRAEIIDQISEIQINIETSNACLDIEALRNLLVQKEAKSEQIKKIVAEAQKFNQSLVQLRDKEIPALQKEKEVAESHKNAAETDLRVTESTLTERVKIRDDLRYRFEASQNALQQKLSHYGAENTYQLKSFRDAWQENARTLENLNQLITNLQHDITLHNQNLENSHNLLIQKQNEQQALETEKAALLAQRKNLMGDTPVDAEENRLKQNIAQLENEKLVAQTETQQLLTQLEKLKAIIAEKNKELTQREQERITDKKREEVIEELKLQKTKAENMAQEIGAIKEKLQNNAEKLGIQALKMQEKQQQEEIYNKWNTLNELIGSKDGKKYRNYAQSLTFEYLIDRANLQLQKMSDRYLLIRTDNPKDPFELEVIDKYQNGEIRTVQNLSGGEKFIVSLSLALGLAHMASKNMRIDSMFIDEGFGTLDSDYLDIALSALANLQSEGKIIGVISHLTELKERIPTHVEVTSVGYGRSVLRIVG